MSLKASGSRPVNPDERSRQQIHKTRKLRRKVEELRSDCNDLYIMILERWDEMMRVYGFLHDNDRAALATQVYEEAQERHEDWMRIHKTAWDIVIKYDQGIMPQQKILSSFAKKVEFAVKFSARRMPSGEDHLHYNKVLPLMGYMDLGDTDTEEERERESQMAEDESLAESGARHPTPPVDEEASAIETD